MPIKPSDVKWGSYLQYEGPFFRGTLPYAPPSNPSWEDKLLQTVTATEGGRYDAINAYDRMILSSGLIQWGEAGQYSVSDMLGAVTKVDLAGLMRALAPALAASNAEFRPNAKGRWRFHFLDDRGEVDRVDEQKQLFLLSSDGLRGSWDDASRDHAKLWAACVANVWQGEEARRAQVAYTAPKLMAFLMPSARAILLGAGTPKENEGWAGALRAGYVSFAANLPVVASKQLEAAVAETNHPAWSPAWCVAILKTLTFGPKIAIYPHRYDAIRRTLETLFGVDLPDFADDLAAWEASNPEVRVLKTVADVQRALIALGFDIGPSGADGQMGPKTKAALVQFQSQNGLVPDGVLGPKTQRALVRALDEKA